MLAEVQTYLDEGRTLRSRLCAERAGLLERLAEVDAALRELEADDGPSVPEQVLAIITAAPAPMKSAEVQRALPRVGKLAVLGALHRLSKRGAIQATGRKGGQRYSVQTTNGGTPA